MIKEHEIVDKKGHVRGEEKRGSTRTGIRRTLRVERLGGERHTDVEAENIRGLVDWPLILTLPIIESYQTNS